MPEVQSSIFPLVLFQPSDREIHLDDSDYDRYER
jgi:hypothetical protein